MTIILWLRAFDPLTTIYIFPHLKLCLADAIHNFKWVKISQIWQMEGKDFQIFCGWRHVLPLTCLKSGIQSDNKNIK